MNLNLDQQIIDALDEMARRERRSRSMMANLLLEQALGLNMSARSLGFWTDADPATQEADS